MMVPLLLPRFTSSSHGAQERRNWSSVKMCLILYCPPLEGSKVVVCCPPSSGNGLAPLSPGGKRSSLPLFFLMHSTGPRDLFEISSKLGTPRLLVQTPVEKEKESGTPFPLTEQDFLFLHISGSSPSLGFPRYMLLRLFYIKENVNCPSPSSLFEQRPSLLGICRVSSGCALYDVFCHSLHIIFIHIIGLESRPSPIPMV